MDTYASHMVNEVHRKLGDEEEDETVYYNATNLEIEIISSESLHYYRVGFINSPAVNRFKRLRKYYSALYIRFIAFKKYFFIFTFVS